MRKPYLLQQEDFDALLALFSPDREEAGRTYERIRINLAKFFAAKGCSNADELADETLNRAASKAASFDPALNPRPASYIYGFASKIFLEQSRQTKGRPVPLDSIVVEAPAEPQGEDMAEGEFDCLEGCLGKIPLESRELLIRYYSREGRERIELRKQMADEVGCSPEVLHTKVFRLRAAVKDCVQRCMKKKTG